MDRQEFDRMLLASLPGALRFAVKLTGDPAAAEDLVQDALASATAAWRSFRGRAAFRTWLFQIIVNRFRDSLRRRESPGELTVEPADPGPVDPAAALIGDELATLVAARVSELPPRQREVLVLVTFEGFTTAEAAGLLGISEQNARVTLHYARQRLRSSLATYMDETKRESGARSIQSD